MVLNGVLIKIGVFIKREEMTEGETALLPLQTKRHQGLMPSSDAGKSQGWVLPRITEGACPSWHLDFRNPASSTVRE